MQYTVITENDESQWSDDTGVLYHFPKRYARLLSPGTRVIYYKGKLVNSEFKAKRLTDKPHYFGVGTIGEVFADPGSGRGDLFATICNFIAFSSPVLAKQGQSYLEIIPESKAKNFWRDGVRACSKEVYESIYHGDAQLPPQIQETAVILDEFESMVEGKPGLRYVTTYERNPAFRRLAIAIHGTQCKACQFDFGKVYGEYGAGFVHIHHIVPVATYGEEHPVDPSTDLIPLCANCHAMVHLRKDKTLSLDDLKALLNS